METMKWKLAVLVDTEVDTVPVDAWSLTHYRLTKA